MPGEILTPHEVTVLKLTAKGLNTKEIAAEIGLGPRAVDGDLGRILKKLGAVNRTNAVAIALRRGILSEEDIDGQGAS